MPAAPEILNAIGKIGLAEVHHEVKTEELGASACNVAVAAEVSINLPGKGVHAEQRHRQARFAERSGERRIRHQRAVIRNHAFTKQAFQNQHQSIERFIRLPISRLLHLRQQVSRTLDWTGDQMREQTNEQAIIQERTGGWKLARVHVHDVGNFLKGVERDARRKNNEQHR